MTAERPGHAHRHPEYDGERDVELARGYVENARPGYGRPPRRPTITLADRLRVFVRRYGWRAYALPILAVLTVAALTTTSASSGSRADNGTGNGNGGGPPASAAPPVAGGSIPLKKDDQGQFSDEVLKAAALPAGAAYTKTGTGTFRTLPGTTAKYGSGTLFRYSIDVENGISGVDLTEFTSMIDKVLADPRSWSGHGVALQRVDGDTAADFRITLTSTMTTRRICGFDIPVETSCYAKQGTAELKDNRVVFNVARWMRGAPAYLGDLNAYRIYMINHEDGHALGHNHAHECLANGLAPAMMQQTFGLRSTRGDSQGKLCAANPWPYPAGVKDAPGAEQADTDANNEYGRGD